MPYFRLLLLLAGLAAAVLAAPESRSQSSLGAPKSRVWQAKWIWSAGDPSPRNSYTYFRKSFDLKDPPREGRIHVTADSRYQLFVNGTLVGRGPVRSDRRWLYYDTWEIGQHLRKQENVVAVLVHHYGESTFQYMQGRGGLIAEVLGFAGVPLAQTDASWRAMSSRAWASGQPRMSVQLGFNEIYDARKEPRGWREPGFDDSAWPPAAEIGPAGMEPWPNLVARDIPAMRETPMQPVKVLQVSEVEAESPAQHVDLLPVMEQKEWAAAYLLTGIHSPDRRQVTLKFGSDDALKVWLNGKPLLERLIDRGAAPDQESVVATLEPGHNHLLAKVVQGHTRWEFYFRMAGSTGGLAQTGPVGGAWAVAGPFGFPEDRTLKSGFDTAFPPEAQLLSLAAGDRNWERFPREARYPDSRGKMVSWRSIEHAAASLQHVSQQMAAGERRPVGVGEASDPDRVIQDGSTGARVKTVGDRRISFLIDFGREVTGYPRFRVRGARGGEVIDMGYGEVLHDEKGGFIPQSSDRVGRLNPDRDGVHYADRYTCREGDQEFQTFDKRGFRYLQVDVRNAPEGIELDRVGIIFSTYPVQYRGAFRCSDERLNRIWEIGRYTCELNMEDAYTDCPWRERAQWWGDARVEALINYYCFGDTRLIRKALRQKGQSLNEEGMTWGVYPTDWDGGRLPSFTLIWVSTLWETYLYTGDREIVEELFPKVRETLDRFFAPRVGERGLLKDIPYWVFIDWAPVDDRGEAGALNAYYYDALRSAAAMARLLGDGSAAEYHRRAGAVKDAMNRHLWDAAAGVYRDSISPEGTRTSKITQQTNSLCVLFDIAPPAEHARILDFIYAPENRARVVEAGSPYFSYYQLASLFHVGRHEQALAYIREKWGRMLDWGATTWWEMWTPGASFCHGWSGGPTYNLGAEVLGVKPLKPGFAEVAVAPHWVGLAYATGVVPTVRGEVRVAWHWDQRSGSAAVRVETEKDVPAEVLLPLEGTVRVNRRSALPAGVTRLSSPRGSMRFRVENGGTALFEISRS